MGAGSAAWVVAAGEAAAAAVAPAAVLEPAGAACVLAVGVELAPWMGAAAGKGGQWPASERQVGAGHSLSLALS